MKLSVVVPSRNETIGLWATVISAKSDLEASGIEHEIIVRENSDVPPQVATRFNDARFTNTKTLYLPRSIGLPSTPETTEPRTPQVMCFSFRMLTANFLTDSSAPFWKIWKPRART